MLRLEKVTGKNVWSILKLSVSQEQESFVAPNDVSIIEAYTAITGNGYAFPFGIYEGETPVGFLMIGFDADDCWEDAPSIARGNYNLWRLMIDKNYQNKGYAKRLVFVRKQAFSLFYDEIGISLPSQSLPRGGVPCEVVSSIFRKMVCRRWHE